MRVEMWVPLSVVVAVSLAVVVVVATNRNRRSPRLVSAASIMVRGVVPGDWLVGFGTVQEITEVAGRQVRLFAGTSTVLLGQEMPVNVLRHPTGRWQKPGVRRESPTYTLDSTSRIIRTGG